MHHLLHPPGGILCTLPAASFAALFFVFSREWTDTGLAYLVYFFSAYSLLILLCAAPWLLEHIRQSVRSRSRSTKQFHGRKCSDSWPTLLIGVVSALAAA